MEKEVYLGLDGRAALVTAGASAVGRVVAQWLARAGCDVAVVDADGEAAERVAEELREHDFTAIAVPAQLTTPAAVEAMVAEVLAQFDALDVAINVPARGTRTPGPLVDPDLLAWSCRVEGRAIAAAGDGGALVNLGALVGPASDLAKGAAASRLALGELAGELAESGIRLNAILGPAAVFGGAAGSPERSASAEVGRGRRPVGPDDLARVAVFLASDLSRSVAGQVLVVDGGAGRRGRGRPAPPPRRRRS